MQCPKCKTESFEPLSVTLAVFSNQQVAVDRCKSCQGIWFDEQELPQLLAAEPQRLSALRAGSGKDELDARRGNCPRDGSVLLRVYSAINRSVVLDTCLQCRGIWLDGGEFEKLLAGR